MTQIRARTPHGVSGPEGRKNLAQGTSPGKQNSDEPIAPEGRESLCRRTFFRPFRGSLPRRNPNPGLSALGYTLSALRALAAGYTLRWASLKRALGAVALLSLPPRS